MVSSMRQDTSSDGEDRVPDGIQDIDQHRTVLAASGTRRESGNLATVHDAANALGVSIDAIRKRIQRGTIPHERHEDGRVYVLLDKASTMQDMSGNAAGMVRDTDQDEDPVRYGTDELVESLRDQIGFLRRELERKDAILLRMVERIPELEISQAPTELRDAPEMAARDHNGAEVSQGTQEPTQRRSWLYRFFFGP